jgi:hypothetical protein
VRAFLEIVLESAAGSPSWGVQRLVPGVTTAMAIDEHDMNQESILWPWVDDPGPDASNESSYAPDFDADPDDIDGDHESGFTSAGWGVDESYGFFEEGS